MRFGVTYHMPAESGSGASSGGTAVGVISDKHEEFKDALEQLELDGAIDRKVNEKANLDAPIGDDRRSRPAQRKQPEPQQRREEPESHDDDQVDDIDTSGVGGETDADTETSGGDIESRSDAFEHDDDMLRLARSYGLSDETSGSLSDAQLRKTLTDISRSRIPDPRQQRRPQQPQSQAETGGQQYPQDNTQQAQAGVPDWKSKVEALRKNDFDKELIEAVESVGQRGDLLAQENELLKSVLANQSGYLNQNAQLQQARDNEALDSLIDGIGDVETFGTLKDFMRPNVQLTEAQQAQVDNAILLQQRVNQIRRATGAPLNKAVVNQAYSDLWGTAKTAAKRESARKVVGQSRQRMGSSGQPSGKNGGKYQGPPERDPDLNAMFNGFTTENRGY